MTMSKRERAIRDMEIGKLYHLGFSEAEFLGWLEQEDVYDCDGVPITGDVAVFRVAGASPRLEQRDRAEAAELLPVSELTRKAYAHDACIRAMDLEHVATDVRLACLAGKTTHVVKGRLPTRYVTRLRTAGYVVEECRLDKPACIGLGKWTSEGHRLTWTP